MPIAQLLLTFLILIPLSGLVAYGVSSIALAKGASTRAWFLICVVSYLPWALLTLLVWHNGIGMTVSVFGCVFGGGLARTRHITHLH